MSYRFCTEPPLWLDRVHAAVIPCDDGSFNPGPDPQDERLYLRLATLSPNLTYAKGEASLKDTVKYIEYHFDILRDEGISIPDGREYYAYHYEDSKHPMLAMQCATVRGSRLDDFPKNSPWSLDFPVAVEYAQEALSAYVDCIEQDGHEWMLEDVFFGLGQLMLGRTLWDGPRPKLYLIDLDPYMVPAKPWSIRLARSLIDEMSVS